MASAFERAHCEQLLGALTTVDPFQPCRSRRRGPVPGRALGSHLINGLSNRDLQQQLWNAPTTDPAQTRRRCQRVCRLIRKLRGHALLAKISGRRRYRVTLRCRRLLAAALHYRRRDFPSALAA